MGGVWVGFKVALSNRPSCRRSESCCHIAPLDACALGNQFFSHRLPLANCIFHPGVLPGTIAADSSNSRLLEIAANETCVLVMKPVIKNIGARDIQAEL